MVRHTHREMIAVQEEVHTHGSQETGGRALGPGPHRDTRGRERSAKGLMTSLHYTEAEHISPSVQGRTVGKLFRLV